MNEYQMPRDEHLKWAKNRALQYVEVGQLQYAFDSLMSDMNKHPETVVDEAVLELGYNLLLTGYLKTPQQMKNFINGFS